jgi:flagellar biosynthesis protein FlhF
MEAESRVAQLQRGDPLSSWLVAADFLPEVATSIKTSVQADPDPRAAVSRTLAERVKVEPGLLPLPDRSRRIALMGPPGAGKTTTLVKLAAQASASARSDMVMVNLDSYRPGAEEYLAQVGDTLRVPVLSERNREVQKGLPEARGLMLIDTEARICGTDRGSMAARATLARLQPDARALVLSAPWRAVDLREAWERYRVCKPTHLVFTGLDLTLRFGGILSVAVITCLPVACVMATGRFDSGTRVLRPEALVQQMQQLQTVASGEREQSRD